MHGLYFFLNQGFVSESSNFKEATEIDDLEFFEFPDVSSPQYYVTSQIPTKDSSPRNECERVNFESVGENWSESIYCVQPTPNANITQPLEIKFSGPSIKKARTVFCESLHMNYNNLFKIRSQIQSNSDKRNTDKRNIRI